MDLVVALYASAAVLLIIAGIAKVVRPASTAALLDDLGVPSLGSINRVAFLSAVETLVGGAALILDLRVFALVVGLLYAVFAAAVVRAMQLGAASCGCFGRIDAPPSWWHVGGNLLLAGASFVAVAGRTPLQIMAEQPLGGIGFVVVVGVFAGVELVLFTSVPATMRRRARR